LARNRRSPKRPSEPRLSGDHPEEGAVAGGCVAFLLEAKNDLYFGRSCSSPILVARPDGFLYTSNGMVRLRLGVKGDTSESLDITGQLGF